MTYDFKLNWIPEVQDQAQGRTVARPARNPLPSSWLILTCCGVRPFQKAVKAGAVDRLTDTSKYTGSHKERFDESGKGKGIAGREEQSSNDGYVQGYKEKDSYDKSH